MAKRKKHKTVKKGPDKKLLYGVTLATIILLAVLVTYYLFYQPNSENWTASIVDQLSVEEGLINQSKTFNASSTSILRAAGFDVKYYPGPVITVEFYKNLPLNGGKIIVLRAHSTVRTATDFVDLFTSEPYNELKERQYSPYGDQISHARFLSWPFTEYFAIGPTFVKNSINPAMKGTFADSLIILMGCQSLNRTSMAEALVERGAKVVIGWTDWISLGETDNVTLALLEYLLMKPKYTIGGAVETINRRIHLILGGEPPAFGARLTYYPSTAKNDFIDTKENHSTLHLLTYLGIPSMMVMIVIPERKHTLTKAAL
ncbi:MAG: hypothetical protein JSV51_04035 [Candidatus Bathyarchaeota archaeon]|nr:MAG: hypothetical protein JSV51_04035 [Candidatus Bathyarchaeota archaeon]